MTVLCLNSPHFLLSIYHGLLPPIAGPWFPQLSYEGTRPVTLAWDICPGATQLSRVGVGGRDLLLPLCQLGHWSHCFANGFHIFVTRVPKCLLGVQG